VKLAELPNLMRALGHYPSEAAVAEMVAEVKYSRFTATGEVLEDLDLPGFVRLFVNHRPVLPVGTAHIERAFVALSADEYGDGRLGWRHLMNALRNAGERLSEEDLKNCLQSLVGNAEEVAERFPQLGARQFAEDILGFEDYEEDGSQEFQQQEEGFGVGDEEGAYY